MKNHGRIEKKSSSFNHIFFYFIIFIFLNKSLKGCDFETPIRKNKICVLEYCTKEEYINSICTIENNIVETQWITNIIWIGEKNFRYVNIATFSTGQMIIETTAYYPGTAQRIFYGLQANGLYSFIKDGVYTPFFSKDATNQINNENNRYEAEVFIAKNKENNKEYLISIPRSNQYIEIYDFETEEIYQKIAADVLENRMSSFRQSALNYTTSNNENYIIFCYSTDKGQSKNKVFLYIDKYQLTSLDNEGFQRIGDPYYVEDIVGNSLSCFLTKNKYIICIYLTKNDSSSLFYIIALNSELIFQYQTTIESPSFYEKGFIKCIHYKEEIGFFSYYSTVNEEPFPYIQCLYYDGEFRNYFENINEIILKKQFNNNYLLNDIIKISDYKICYIAPSDDKEELYIVILNIYGKEKVIIRYYNIKLFVLHNYKILFDIAGHLYNNYIAFAFSFCQQESCSSDKDDEHYSAFMIFSYPNSTDISINLKDYLFEKNIDIDDFRINLREYVKIENNIFGYTYSGIKIEDLKNTGNGLDFFSSLSESQYIGINSVLKENESIKISFGTVNYYYTFNYTIKFSYIIGEPTYSVYNTYLNDKDEEYGIDTEDLYLSQKDEYTGRIGYYNIYLKDNLEKNNCEDPNCLLCYLDYNSKCFVCRYNFTYEIIDGETLKKCDETILSTEENYVIDSTEIEKITEKIFGTEKIDNTEKINNEEKINNTEKINNAEKINNTEKENEIKEIFNELKEQLLSKDYSGDNIINIDNVIIHISTVDNQKYSENENVSSIDLGECEDVLKERYGLYNESILIIKMDIKNENSSYTYVQYELYHPINKTQLNLDYCTELGIYINVPVDLSNEILLLYDSLNEINHNLFNKNDSFYNDICIAYTSLNGTDVLLQDRQRDIYSLYGNISACQNGCELESYNKTTKKVKCNCEIQKAETNFNLTKILSDFTSQKIEEILFETMTNSNFKVLKCYKLVFSTKDIFKNIGRIIMSLIYLIFIILIIIYSIKNRIRINKYLNQILESKLSYEDKKMGKTFKSLYKTLKILDQNKNHGDKTRSEKKEFDKKKEKNIKSEINKKNKNNKDEKNRSPKTTRITYISKKESEKNNLYNFPPKRKNNKILRNNISNKEIENKTYTISNTNRLLSEENNQKIYMKNKVCLKEINIYQNKNSGDIEVKTTEKGKVLIENQKGNVNKEHDSNYNYYKRMNDQEINSLSYEDAIKYDKRTYFQYYWSLLKKKQLLLFTFFPQKDYNLLSLKISLFLVSFSLYFTINAFFFTDETMHKIYEDHGVYDFLYQIPIILYSTIISTFLNMILKILSLSEKNILSLKQEKELKIAKKKAIKIKNYITIKFIIFFILSNFLLLFYWYFISCFCAVYINTQKILIKDTLISFTISMIYPFGINLLPGLFRMPAIKEPKKDKKLLYQFSLIIALF